MRAFFYLLGLAALILWLVGLGSPPPLLNGIDGQVLDDWYSVLGWWCAGTGLIAGVLGAEWARRSIRHRPDESGRAFHRKVQTKGVVVLAVTAALCILSGALLAAFKGDIPLGTAERIGTLITTRRFIGMVGLGVYTASIVYTLRTTMGLWGGKYALVPRRTRSRSQAT